ncbi:MAG TPA: thioesterase family protein [Candidatus Limnocylindrales bacterium]|nr:thioesterase family protein [Candidatus Limnocylindrales bacterium]
MDSSLFTRDPAHPNLFHPTELTRGPWTPVAQHGGPPSALLAMALEAYDDAKAPRHPDGSDDAMFIARLNVELLKPVPLTPLVVSVTTERPGRKVQILSASLSSDGKEVARATALRIRRTHVALPEGCFPALQPPPRPSTGYDTSTPWRHGDLLAFHSHAVDHRFIEGGFDRPGPAIDWIRLRVPLVAGEATPPVSRVAAAADFGNGVSWTLSRVDGYVFINPDLTLYLHAYPAGEWVCLDAVTYPQPHGVGLAESRLWGEQGVLGRSLQSLLIEHEP